MNCLLISLQSTSRSRTGPPLSSGRSLALAAALSALAWSSLAACSSDPDGDARDDESADRDSDDAADRETELGPLYALSLMVQDPEGRRTTYVEVRDSLDLEDALEDAHEYPGIASINTIGGRLLVASGEEPTITEYDFSDEGEWLEGDKLSFGDYPLPDNANWYYQFIQNEHTVYLPFDGYKRVIWDPSELSLGPTEEDSSLESEWEGLPLRAGANPTAIRYEDRAVLQPFHYADDDEYEFGPDSFIVAYDPKTHRERDVMQVPCPGLQVATLDEDGYVYFSTRHYLPGLALWNAGPKPCTARVTPDGELDAAWTTDLTDLTDGRYAVNFRYVGDGRAIANVLHHEELDADLDGPLDPEVVTDLWRNAPHWKVWLFDLERRSAAPLEGIDVEVGSETQTARLDGRTFLLTPVEDWTHTKVYELGDDGVAKEYAETSANLLSWMRIR
jgi:hypothetical protein